MENFKITENNKAIAEFMQVGKLNDKIYAWLNEQTGATDFLAANELRYEKSWDWLMPVVDNINCRGVNEGDEGFNLIEVIWDAITDVSIIEAYEAIIEFIKWYNENK